MRCVICNQEIKQQESSVATTNGGRVHSLCADQQARVARRLRAIKAVVSGVIVIAGVTAAILVHGSAVVIILIGLLGMAAHIGLNRLWWRLRMQSFGLRWRMRRQWWRRWRR
jgi:hypothetical protein